MTSKEKPPSPLTRQGAKGNARINETTAEWSPPPMNAEAVEVFTELAALPRYVGYVAAYNPKRHKWDKIPHDGARNLSTTDESHWGPMLEVAQAATGRALSGFGLVFTGGIEVDGETLVGFDFDGVTGPIPLLETLDTYCELSPSGTGTHSQLAVKWFMDSMTRTPAREPQRHRYNLYEHVNDPVFQSFANYASDCGFSQKLITDACWWVSECGRKLNQNSSSQTPRTEPLQSKDPTDSLTDAQFEQVVRINQQAAMNTEITLRRKWGDSSYLQNIQVAQRYLDSLPPKERAHFEQFTSGWIRALNTAEVIEGLFNMAIGAANIPTSGGSVQAEISQIEGLMRDPVSRRAYLKDAELQARLRFLYTMRDDG